MRSKDNIKELLDYFQNLEDHPWEGDEEAIIAAYQKVDGNQPLAIKILSIIGGVLASFVFLGYLLISGLYNSNVGLLLFGGIFIAVSLWINKEYDRIILDAISVSCFIIGFILLGSGCYLLKINENVISIIFIIIALGSLFIVQNYILSFISVLIINGSILSLIILNNAYDFIHIYVSLLALTITYFFLREAAIITTHKVLSTLYSPIRTGLIFSFLSGLVCLGKKGILPVSTEYIWVSSVIIIFLISYFISILFDIINITETRHKIRICIFTVLTLLPTALSPAISGAILIILLSFLVNYKTSLVVGIVSFIYFVYQYYYDLNFTLLIKSILLFSTGVLFIAFYLFTYKKLTANEKV